MTTILAAFAAIGIATILGGLLYAANLIADYVTHTIRKGV